MVGFCSSPVVLNLISKLHPVALNFGKDFEVLFKIKKGSCSDTGLFPLVEATYSWLTEGASPVGIALSLFRNILAIFQFVIIITYLMYIDA